MNIYLPDALAESVKRWDLSVSPICQRALEEEIRKMEAAATATSDLEKVAERLRGTIAEDAVKNHEQGFECGAEWAKDRATFAELHTVVNRTYENHDPGRYLAGIRSTVEYIVNWYGLDPDTFIDSEDFVSGFYDGVKTVYDKVCPLL